jgi:hypothetical protein
MTDNKNLMDARIQHTPLNRWENEGGATASGHEKAVATHSCKTTTPQNALLRKKANETL